MSGPILTGLEVGDAPDAWRGAGFAVDEHGRCVIGHVAIDLIGTDTGRGIRRWRFDTVTGDDLDGLHLAAAASAPDAAPVHPNGVVGIDHLVVLTPNHDRTTAAFEAVGIDLRRVRETDQYGFPAEQRFFRAGEVILEVIGPATAEPGDDRPAAFFGLAHTVDSLDATAGLLGEHLGTIKPAVQPGRRIATLRHRDLHLSVATALMSGPAGRG